MDHGAHVERTLRFVDAAAVSSSAQGIEPLSFAAARDPVVTEQPPQEHQGRATRAVEPPLREAAHVSTGGGATSTSTTWAQPRMQN